jgi:hypothetical protein
LHFRTSTVDPQYTNYRAVAFSVRCVKNIPPLSLLSVSYTPPQATRTSGSVTVTVTLDQTGSALTGWTLNGTVFTKTYTTNATEDVTFTSTLGGTVTTGISIQNIDTTVPSVNFSPNGGTAYLSNHSTLVTVTDTGASVDTGSLKYQRSTSATAPEESSFITPFTNGETLTLSGTNGAFYLRILAKDTVGNTTILSSNVFNINTSIITYP